MIDNEKYLSVRSSSAYSSASDEFTDESAETCQPTADMTGKIRLSKLLGRGAFGEVYEGFTVDSSSVAGRVAVKKIKGWCIDQLLPEITKCIINPYNLEIFKLGSW